MNDKLIGAALLSLPLFAGGLVFASTQRPAGEQVQKAEAQGYICPATGEVLPCQDCCPLSNQ